MGVTPYFRGMQVKTLGGLDAGIKPMKPKNLLLLCYLALEGKQDRKHLQMLFWPEAADPATSLRVALSYLQSLEKDLFKSVQNQVEALIHTDAQRLMQAHQQNQHSEVIGLYAGAFLKGLDLRNTSTELEDWIFETREKLASLVQWSILKEAQRVRFSAPEQFQPLMEKFFQVEGAPPPTLEMLRFMYSLGLEGYLEHRVLKEAAELGVDLTTLQVPQKTNLQSAIRPVQVFVGREQEMQLLHERLQQNPPGIVSVTGLGGVGKSTLVRMYCATHHPENTLWLKADGLKDASGLLHQLGLNVQQADPWVGLTDTLRHHKGLVVIDGADQLSGLEHLQNWLRFPDLRVLVTCRQPLQLPEESLLKLEPFSIQEYRGMGLSEVLGHPAVQCFEKHAKRHHAAFKIQPEDAQDALHLCAALSGLPLALEMASSWTQILSLKEIKAEVQQVVDPEGDPQSLKPIFEASWNLLSEQEKQALTNLNCFLGSFTREAAVMVSGVQLRMLQQLVRKSMLQLEPFQRFRVPQVLRGFIPALDPNILQKYQEYHLHLLNSLETQFGKGLQEYSGSVPDLMDVLRQTVNKQNPQTLPLLRLFENEFSYHTGLQFYSDLIKSLSIDEHSNFYVEYAWLCYLGGETREAMEICYKLMSIDHAETKMKVYNIIGSCKMYHLDYLSAEECFLIACDIAKTLSDHERIVLYGINMLFSMGARGDLYAINEKFNDLKNSQLFLENKFYKIYICYAFEYNKMISGDEISLDLIDGLIEESQEGKFVNMEIALKYTKAKYQCQKAPSLADESYLQYLKMACDNIKQFSMSNSLSIDLMIHKILNQGFDDKFLESLILDIKKHKDKSAAMELIFKASALLEKWSSDFLLNGIPSLSHHYKKLKYYIKVEEALRENKTSMKKTDEEVLFKMLLQVTEWLRIKDRLELLEEGFQHRHLRPADTGVPHPPEPHPRGPERSL